MTILHVLVTLFIYFISSKEINVLYPHTALNTHLKCTTTRDCRGYYNNSWCRSGNICINGYCRTIPDYPCKKAQICNEVKQRCDNRYCRVNSECDNDVFCDGIEVCTLGRCVSSDGTNCYGGICLEQEKRCIFNNIQLEWKEYKKTELKNIISGKGINIKTNSTDPIETINLGLWVIIIFACGFGIILIIIVIVITTRTAPVVAVPGSIYGYGESSHPRYVYGDKKSNLSRKK